MQAEGNEHMGEAEIRAEMSSPLRLPKYPDRDEDLQRDIDAIDREIEDEVE